jgi:hypothetical protein
MNRLSALQDHLRELRKTNKKEYLKQLCSPALWRLYFGVYKTLSTRIIANYRIIKKEDPEYARLWLNKIITAQIIYPFFKPVVDVAQKFELYWTIKRWRMVREG